MLLILTLKSFQGLVDLENEIAKCQKLLDLAHLNLQKIVKLESQPEYEETVPSNVRAANTDKVFFSPKSLVFIHIDCVSEFLAQNNRG